jgi:hypothetical protein
MKIKFDNLSSSALQLFSSSALQLFSSSALQLFSSLIIGLLFSFSASAADYYCTCPSGPPCTCYNGGSNTPQIDPDSHQGSVSISGSSTTQIVFTCRNGMYESADLQHSGNISCSYGTCSSGQYCDLCTNWDTSTSNMQVPYFSCR